MDIPGIPDSIPRSRLLEMLASLGLDPAELVAFRMEWNAIYAEVFALDEQGRRYIDGNDVAMHRIAIHITDSVPKDDKRPAASHASDG